VGRERRRFDRIEASIPVVLKRGGAQVPLLTGDVSRHGAFIRTDAPCPERELVQLVFELPGTHALDVMCMVTRSIPPARAGARGPGMGVAFFALSKEAKDLWDRWVLAATRRGRPVPDELPLVTGELVLPPPALALDDVAPLPLRREHPRHQACFLVRLADRAALHELVTRDISEGGTFISTPLRKPPGEQVTLVLIHPETDDQFPIPGTVVRVDDGLNGARGLAVRFDPLDEETRARLEEFIDTGIETLEILDDPRKARVAMLEAEVRRAPEDPALLEELGVARLDADDVAGAVEALTQAMLRSPSMPGIHRALSDAYAVLGDDVRARAHQRVSICLQKYAGDLLAAELQRTH